MAAAERVFLEYGPYLRKAICRHFPASLRAKFDPADIVQSVWADVLRGFREAGWRFVDADHLRGFLFVATRNRLIDRIRQHQRAAEREEPIDDGAVRYDVPSAEPRPSAVVPANAAWARIMA